MSNKKNLDVVETVEEIKDEAVENVKEAKKTFVDKTYQKYCDKRNKKLEKKAEKQAAKEAKKAEKENSEKKQIPLAAKIGAGVVLAGGIAGVVFKTVMSRGGTDEDVELLDTNEPVAEIPETVETPEAEAQEV